ncbi:tumor necrosis factor receptor superfamily member 11A-like isoform X2 [Heptranchias perlo]
MKRFEVLRKGNTVTATQCICRADYHCSQDCEYCLRDSPCFPGFEVKEKANRKSDTKCGPCPPMYFSNETSFTVKCKQRTNCTALGLMEKVPGNTTSDTVCINVSASTSPSSDDSILAIAVGPACGCGIIIAFIFVIISYRKSLTTLKDCVQQRFADARCSIRGKKRNEGNPPADPAISKLPSDNPNWDPESELFLTHKKLVEATDRANGSIFYTLSERPDCSYVLNPYCGVESLSNVTHSPRIPRENPDSDYYIANEGESSSTTLLEDTSTGTSIKPLLSSGYEMEEAIHSNYSTQESRNTVDIAPFRDSQEQTPPSTPASGSTPPLSSKQSDKDRTPKCDCHTDHQSNPSNSTQKSENTDGHSSYNPGSDNPNPDNESSHKSGNSTPSDFSCGGNTTYNTRGQSVLNVGGSVIFNVIFKVNHTTEQDNRGDMNDGANFPTKEDNEDNRENSRGNDRFPMKEEKPDSKCDFETNPGFPMQEEGSKETVCVPVQEEQNRINGHEVNFPIQEKQYSRESLEESLSFARKTVEQEIWGHPKENTFFPVQEDGKSEHLPNEEQNQ